MQVLLMLASFTAYILLSMSAKLSRMPASFLALAIGIGLILWKKPKQDFSRISKSSVFLVGFSLLYSGWIFYKQWMLSSKVRKLAILLHMPQPVIVVLAAIVLSLCAMYFVYAMLEMGKKYLERLTAKKHHFLRDLILFLAVAVFVVSLGQMMIDTSLLEMSLFKLALNVGIVYILCLVLYCITGSVKGSVWPVTGIWLLAFVANVYIYTFRERLFEPVDILSIGTAMNVADNYSLLPTPATVLIGVLGWVAVNIWICAIGTKEKHSPSGKQRAVLALCCLLGIASVAVYANGVKTYHWKREGAIFHGYVLDFVSKFKEMSVAKPKDYDPDRFEELLEQYATTTTPDTEKKPPHIIVIMDEAFSDLRVLGDLSTNKEVTPFVSSLKEDTISGYALASVYGGNTANSEYEFLTGNSVAWLSPNAVPYQQYIRSSAYSMVSYLKTNYQYRCVAMHPYQASGWNRPNTYRNLGFDEMLFEEDFPQVQYVREYISDQEMFETIVDTYERQKQEPLFLFGVSMQNHGSYKYNGADFAPSISLTGLENEHPDVEQYLSLIHETDKAVEYLISYFRQVEEEVVIVFFGDHQPRLNETFYTDMAKDSDELEDIQKRHMVPFFVWANYDIEEKSVARTSLNYLSSFVYEAAGIPLPPYNRFLREMEEKIPVINANGFYSADSQCYLPLDEASEAEQKWLALYEQLQYNSLVDIKHRNESFFPILNP